MLTTTRHGVTSREWRIAFVLAVVLMTLTTLPYLIGFATQDAKPGDQFGGLLFNTLDINSYLAKIREGAAGDGLLHLVYTSEPHAGAWLYVPYLAAGKLTNLFVNPEDPGFALAALLVYHLARILCGLLAILASFRLAALFLPRGGARWLALIVISLGGGFGWLLFMLGLGNWLGSAPVDIYMPEAYTFLMLYGLPHLALARAMLLTGFVLLGTRQGWQATLLAGGAWAIMGLCVPFDVAVLYALLGAWGIVYTIRTRKLPIRWALRLLAAAFIPAPGLLYSLIVVGQNSAFAIFNAQNILPSPNPIQYLIAFGLLTIPALFGIRWAWRRAKHQPFYALLIAWVIAAPLMAYIPVSVQRRLIEGIWVPLSVLAIVGLRFAIVPFLARRRALCRRRINSRRLWRYMAAATVMFTVPTSLLLLLTGSAAAASHADRLYHTADELTTYDWLDTHTVSGAVILSSLDTGNYLPVRTHVRAFLGHGVETLHSERKQRFVTDFYNGVKTLADIQMPDEDPIRFVIFGPAERSLIAKTPGDNQPPTWVNGLTMVYQLGAYTIYQVP